MAVNASGAKESVLLPIDKEVAKIACVFCQKFKAARDKAKDKRDVMAIGREAERETKNALIGDGKMFDSKAILRNQTGVDGPSGGGDLRSMYMFDLSFEMLPERVRKNEMDSVKPL